MWLIGLYPLNFFPIKYVLLWVLLIILCKINSCLTHWGAILKVLNQNLNLKFHQMDFWFDFLNIHMNEKIIFFCDCHGFKWQNRNIYPILIFFLCGLMPFLAHCNVIAPFCFDKMACCANGVMPNLKHNKPFLFGVLFINLSINITECEVDDWVEQGLFLFRVHFLLHQHFNLTNYIFLQELPLVQNGCKIHVKQCFLTNMFKMKGVAIVNVTSQIYKLHGFVPNSCEFCYFMGSYCLHTNVMHYLNMEVIYMTFMYKQHK